jgi:hypothetical protein
MTELSSRDETIIIAIEYLIKQDTLVTVTRWYFSIYCGVSYLERLPDFFLGVGILHLSCHHGQKLCRTLGIQLSLIVHDIIPGKSIVPLLSASTSLIISCSSDSDGFWPRDRITVPSSFVVICPKGQVLATRLRILTSCAMYVDPRCNVSAAMIDPEIPQKLTVIA